MKSIYLLLILIVFNIINVQAQNITGKVYELNEQKQKIPLPSVNIYWENTSIGTSTNESGSYTIPKSSQSSKLVISYIGYKTDTIEIRANQKEANITLSVNRTLGEVVVEERSNSTYVSKIDPIHTQTITVNELCRAACCNLSESFETNASVDVSYSDAVSGAKQIQLLGLAGVYSQLMTENIPSLKGLSTAFGLGYIPGTWMESIQVSKGTASVVNGYESITGQINVEYKKPENTEILGINGFYSSEMKAEGNLTAATKIGKNWSTMILSHIERNTTKTDHNIDGFLDHPLVEQYNFINRWKYDSKKIPIQIGVKVLDENRIGGQMDFKESMGANNSIYGIDIKTLKYEAFSKIGYILARPNTSFGFINSASYFDQHSYFGVRYYNGTQKSTYSNLIFQSYIGNNNHKYTTGLSYIYNDYNETLTDTNLLKTEQVSGAFFQYTYDYSNIFTFMAGIRADNNSLYGTFFTPRVHVKYEINEKTTVRASAGKGYRTPNVIAENFSLLASSRNFIFKEKLKQEEAWNYGISLSRRITVLSKPLTLTGELYRTDFVNQVIVDMDQDPSKAIFYNLDGKSYANNMQIEMNWQPVKRFDLTLAYRYSDVKSTINNKLEEKPMVNKYKGLVTLSYATKLRKWQFDFTTQLNGTGRLPNTKSNPTQYQLEETHPAYTIINAQVTKFFKLWSVYVGVENLTNFKQHHPIIAHDDPFGPNFDASIVWGPITGRMLYAGFRFQLNKKTSDKKEITN